MLQLPVLELSTAISEELVLNPLLELSEVHRSSDTAADSEEFDILRTLDRSARTVADKEGKDLKSSLRIHSSQKHRSFSIL